MMADGQTATGGMSTRYAVRAGENEAETRAIAAFLEARGREDVTHYLPKDDDDLTRDLCAGKYDVVVFAGLDALMAMTWKGEAEMERWREVGVEITFAESAVVERMDAADVMHRVGSSLEAWRQGRRRRQTVAAVLLSVIALVAAGVLMFLIPPAK